MPSCCKVAAAMAWTNPARAGLPFLDGHYIAREVNYGSAPIRVE